MANHIQTMTDILLQSISQDFDRLNLVLSRLAGIAEFISLSPPSLTLAQTYQRTIRMEPPDSLVLASVIVHLSETNPGTSCFLNKNIKDFGEPNVKNELSNRACRLIYNFEHGLNYISSTLGL